MPSAFTYPTSDTSECALLVVPMPLLPFVVGAVGQLQDRCYWDTDQDWYAAYEAIAAFEACAMTTCLSELIESNNRIYRLLDTALFGTAYSVVTTDPLVVEPALGPTHDLTIQDDLSIFGRMEKQKQLLENALNGTSTVNYSRADGVRDLLEQLKTALESAGASDADSLEQLIQIAALLA